MPLSALQRSVSLSSHTERSQPSGYADAVRTPNQRPRRHVVAPPPDGVDLSTAAASAVYVGSPEHKSFPSFAGPPKLRADATKCPPHLADPSELTAWLRMAIAKAHCGPPFEGGFPRYAWYRHDEAWYEARLVNREQGEYKGYPILDEECPEGL